ncbi:hypothetical protein PR048_031405 [Dryococelus australis]|uniref:Uncharacterized protein n=1 Tax=Dryococelus australis TaxID=614101 RepID=A0ABQ9G5X6_9NEOP|nr:hypothetical protein PR048_031405 [Dryococelus australis]
MKENHTCSYYSRELCHIFCSSGQELYYEINSHIVTVDLQQDGQKTINGIFSISLQFNSVFKTYDAEEWDTKCAMTQYLSISHPWDLGSCLMERPRSLHTVWCRCSRPGAYAVLLTSRVTQAGAVEREPHQVVLLGCVFCLLQTVFTLLLLLPYWWRHRSCIIYLKLQCCTATSGAMGIFIYAVRDSIPKASRPGTTSHSGPLRARAR